MRKNCVLPEGREQILPRAMQQVQLPSCWICGPLLASHHTTMRQQVNGRVAPACGSLQLSHGVLTATATALWWMQRAAILSAGKFVASMGCPSPRGERKTWRVGKLSWISGLRTIFVSLPAARLRIPRVLLEVAMTLALDSALMNSVVMGLCKWFLTAITLARVYTYHRNRNLRRLMRAMTGYPESAPLRWLFWRGLGLSLPAGCEPEPISEGFIVKDADCQWQRREKKVDGERMREVDD
jgi:hypothetical protein